MHPYHLEVLAAERQRHLRAEADWRHVARYARMAAMTGTRRRARTLIALDALTAFARRWRRKARIAFAADITESTARGRKREPIRGF